MLVIRMYCGADSFMEAILMSMLCKRRLLFLEAVRIKSVSCVLYRKIRMRVTRMRVTRMRVTRMTMRVMCHCKMRVTCHCKMRATCSRKEGSLQKSPICSAATPCDLKSRNTSFTVGPSSCSNIRVCS